MFAIVKRLVPLRVRWARPRRVGAELPCAVRATRKAKRRAAKLLDGEKRFYRQLVAKADDRFDAHLAGLEQRGTPRGAAKKRKQRS